jgi:hypothetical protein
MSLISRHLDGAHAGLRLTDLPDYAALRARNAGPPPPGSPFLTRAEREDGVRDPHSGIMHRALIGLLGMPIGELWNLDALAAACTVDRRWSFLLTMAPLSIVGGVGSPANAIALR